MLANAIVLPVSFEVLRPYKKQITAAAAIISPSEITLNKNDFVSIDSLIGRGFSFITSFE